MTNPARVTPMTISSDLVARLRDVGCGRIAHINRGECPYDSSLSDRRDSDCPACQVLCEADTALDVAEDLAAQDPCPPAILKRGGLITVAELETIGPTPIAPPPRGAPPIQCNHCGNQVTVAPSRGALMVRATQAGSELYNATQRLRGIPDTRANAAARLNAQAAVALATSCKEAADAALEEAGGRYGTTPPEGVTL